jgi:hypothetical protein
MVSSCGVLGGLGIAYALVNASKASALAREAQHRRAALATAPT